MDKGVNGKNQTGGSGDGGMGERGQAALPDLELIGLEQWSGNLKAFPTGAVSAASGAEAI
jgi:hypothetical protein